jgi:hypothetical protein
VIIIERIDLGPGIEQKPCDFDRAGEVQRLLAIAALAMDERGIVGDDLL